MFKNILVPTDGSPLSQDTVSRAASFASEAGARITLFYARPESLAAYEGLGAISDAHFAQEVRERLDDAATEILEDAEARLREAGVEFQRVVLMGNSPYELIIRAAMANDCDLIFMASHGRRGLNSLLVGSETRKVLTHSKIPVLVYR